MMKKINEIELNTVNGGIFRPLSGDSENDYRPLANDNPDWLPIPLPNPPFPIGVNADNGNGDFF